eukprot:CAMPEP_0198704624 /NCGR_PEP_ID=MMETSP1468-20131203/389999_1 /TAXON_ID=1461545 /ORGANISM="Mantoniella sp, Strain CCMP1436" /LENGTH=610 /DNA_ID=CAMNT_0044463447 /DNA_START=432 /DNA_END=2261 /DNA_ORIENTATION=+
MPDNIWATFIVITGGSIGGYVEDNAPSTASKRVWAGYMAIVGSLYSSFVLAIVVDFVRVYITARREGLSLREKDHTVMLGFTEKSLMIIKEIINANEYKGGTLIAVLCAESSDTMEEDLSRSMKGTDRKGTTIVFRQGDSLIASDLDKVSVTTARSVVVLSNTSLKPDQADAEVLQVISNLSSLKLSGHVVAEVCDENNEQLIRCIGSGIYDAGDCVKHSDKDAGDRDANIEPQNRLFRRSKVETVVSHDVIGRLMLMTMHQPGNISEVYGNLLTFGANRISIKTWPQLAGVPFKDVQLMMPHAVPIGVIRVDELDNAKILNPHNHIMLRTDDKLVVIADVNGKYIPQKKHKCVPGETPRGELREKRKKRMKELRDKLAAAQKKLEDRKTVMDTEEYREAVQLNIGTLQAEHKAEIAVYEKELKKAEAEYDTGVKGLIAQLGDTQVCRAAERMIIFFVGWRRDLGDIVMRLNQTCPKGSEIHIMATVARDQRDMLLDLDPHIDLDIKVHHHVGNTAMWRYIEGIDIMKPNSEKPCTSCVIFADEEVDSIQSDARCLTTHLLIRDIQSGKPNPSRRRPSMGTPGADVAMRPAASGPAAAQPATAQGQSKPE